MDTTDAHAVRQKMQYAANEILLDGPMSKHDIVELMRRDFIDAILLPSRTDNIEEFRVVIGEYLVTFDHHLRDEWVPVVEQQNVDYQTYKKLGWEIESLSE